MAHFESERDYLAGLTPPLAKAKSRGRFSAKAHEALAEARKQGHTFGGTPSKTPAPKGDAKGNSQASGSSESGAYPPIPSKPRVRQVDSAMGLTPEGWRVGFSICRRCTAHISRCDCDQGPKPPHNVVTILDEHLLARVESGQEVTRGSNVSGTEVARQDH